MNQGGYRKDRSELSMRLHVYLARLDSDHQLMTRAILDLFEINKSSNSSFLQGSCLGHAQARLHLA